MLFCDLEQNEKLISLLCTILVFWTFLSGYLLCPLVSPFSSSLSSTASFILPPFSSPQLFSLPPYFSPPENFYSICFLPLMCKLFPTSQYNCCLSGQVAGLFYPYGAFWFELSAALPIMGSTGFCLRKMEQHR